MDFYLLVLGLILLGIVAGFLAGFFGIGGGIIIIPGLLFLFEWSHWVAPELAMHLALGSSLASVVFITGIALIIHAKETPIKWTIVKQLVPGLLLGACMGSYWSSLLDTHYLTLLFAAFLAIIGLRFIVNWHSNVAYPLLPWPLMVLAGVGMGTVTSLLGLGGGVLLIPFLHLFSLRMHEISALSIVCILPVAAMATLGYIIFGISAPDLPRFATGFVYWPAVWVMVLSSSLMTPYGIVLAKRLHAEKLKRLLGIFLLIVSISLFMVK